MTHQHHCVHVRARSQRVIWKTVFVVTMSWLIPLSSPQIRSLPPDALSDFEGVGESSLMLVSGNGKYKPKCWGWEKGCERGKPSKCSPEFTTSASPSVPAKHFHNMVDWGLVHLNRRLMKDFCVGRHNNSDDDNHSGSEEQGHDENGSLRCVTGKLANGRGVNLPYCEAKQLVLDFSKAVNGDYIMYSRWPEGGIAIGCAALDQSLQEMKSANVGNSWGQELSDAVVLTTPYSDVGCDIRIREKTLLVKTDFPHHIYHHFTSIFNVWLSLHIAGWPTDGSVRVVFLDKFTGNRKTEEHSPTEFLGVFTEAWFLFTHHPILDKRHLSTKKKVCFDDAVFTYPPRASFFYPTRGVSCNSSGLMTTFVDWMLHNMSMYDDGNSAEMKQKQTRDGIDSTPAININTKEDAAAADDDVDVAGIRLKLTTTIIRITFITRNVKAKNRKLLNEALLLAAARVWLQKQTSTTTNNNNNVVYEINAVDFAGMSFRKQISVVRSSDILMGMHGAGLTHLLWLPRQFKRVAVIEIFNTFDEFCFKDLAMLGGVKYFTWSASLEMLSPSIPVSDVVARNAKQIDYSPDQAEFVQLIQQAVTYVTDKRDKRDTSNTSETSDPRHPHDGSHTEL